MTALPAGRNRPTDWFLRWELVAGEGLSASVAVFRKARLTFLDWKRELSMLSPTNQVEFHGTNKKAIEQMLDGSSKFKLLDFY